MGIDDVSKIVNAAMWIAFGFTVLALLLAWQPSRSGKLGRPIAAILLGGPCWAYNVGLLLGATQASTRWCGVAGVVVGLATAYRLSLSDWGGLGSANSQPARLALVLTAWCSLAVVLFALLRFGS
jgi:hypothetical protein